MLPPVELNTICLRCGAGLALEQRYCAGCGADRELELAVAAELHPAISTLQRWLAALGLVEVVSAAVTCSYLRWMDAPGDFSSDVMPSLARAGVLFLLCVVARLLPLGASVAALALFTAQIGPLVMSDPIGVLSPGPILLLRILFFFVLIGAVHAGLKARGLRRRAFDAFPRAVASFQCESTRAKENR